MHPIPSAHDLDTCHQIGRQARELYPDCEWLEIEPIARRVWESHVRPLSWLQVSAIVRMSYGDASADRADHES